MRRHWPVVALLFALGCGPLVMVPGGELSGTVKPAPSDWSFTDSVETVQLETRPEDPYSVNVWGVAAGDAFYVASGRGESAAWAKHIAADPRVRLRVGEDLYELSAVAGVPLAHHALRRLRARVSVRSAGRRDGRRRP